MAWYYRYRGLISGDFWHTIRYLTVLTPSRRGSEPRDLIWKPRSSQATTETAKFRSSEGPPPRVPKINELASLVALIEQIFLTALSV